MPRPGTISAWSVSLKLLKLIGQGCPRNFTDLGGDDLALGIDEDRGRKDAVAGPVHEGHVRVEHHRAGRYPAREQVIGNGLRSEAHTSELQSLMRISYAVFCLTTQKT